MNLLADIAHGNTTWADIFFLVAVIICFLAAFLHFTNTPPTWLPGAVVIGLGFVALGLMVL